MAAFEHGIKTSQAATSVSTPVVTASGIPFVVGTAPIHTVGGKTNEIILANNYSEAAAALGYSDDWDKYTLCEFMYSHFKLYNMGPVLFVNVLDPAENKKTVPAAQYSITDNIAKLPLDAIKSTVKVTSTAEGDVTYNADEDYTLYYSDDGLTLELLPKSSISGKEVYVAFDTVDTESVKVKDIIGGYDISSGKSTGLELVEYCFSKYLLIPDLILAPGYSSDSEVAAVMTAKAMSIDGIFEGHALIDADCSSVKNYSDVNKWKTTKSITSRNQIICWPMVTLGERKFHMSTHLAGVIAMTDSANDDCPSNSPSNKDAQIDGLCFADGTECSLNRTQANYLNSCGIVTCLNFVGGFKIWGNETACYPSNTDVKDYFTNVNRTFAWVAKNFILSFWNKIDGNITRRLIDSITDSFNIYLNGLTRSEKILGGRIEFTADDNAVTDLMGGKIKFKTYITPPSPAREIENEFEYDVSYLSDLWS